MRTGPDLAGFFELGLGGLLWAPLWLVFFGFARAIYQQTWLLWREPAALTLTRHRTRVKQAAAKGCVSGEETQQSKKVYTAKSIYYAKSSRSPAGRRGRS